MPHDAPAAGPEPDGPDALDEHLRTDDVRADLRERSVRSGLVTIGAQAIQLVTGVGSVMVLARLLTPADFGLLAMANSLVLFVDQIRSGGLSMATVQKEDATHRQVSALFWLNVWLQVLVAGGVVLSAPALAWFYGETRLTAITAVMAVGLLVLGLSKLHEALLQRQMRFGTMVLLTVGSTFAGAVVGVGAAVLGAGYWALVFQYLATSVSRGALAWVACAWRPARGAWRSERSSAGLRSMLSYGLDLTGFRILERIALSSDRIAVGYAGGARPLGLYDNAYKWSRFPFMQIYLPLFNVVMSSLSRVQDDPKAYRAYFRKGLLPIFALPMPALAFMIVEAHDVILLLLGEQWLDAVPLFQLLCASMFAESISKVTKLLYLSQGETRRQLQWGLVSAPVLVLGVLAGVPWGAWGVAVGWTTATVLLVYPTLAFCLRVLPLRLRDVVQVIWRPAVASIAAAGALLASHSVLPATSSTLVDVLIRGGVFGSAYLLLWTGLPGGREATADVLRIVKAFWKQKRSSHA